jgi:DNA invertase Pin-like site-specific DNA recombinase
MTVYGYARVSTDDQSLSAQLVELKAAKCAKIFQEKINGARSDRKQLSRLMAVLEKGDVLAVTRLDRLARSTRGSPQPSGDHRRERSWLQIAEGCLG